MTATANLSALRAAAVSGDRFAMLALADVAEAGMDDARAGAWRWLADPPAGGWERRACGRCRQDTTTPHGGVVVWADVLLFFGPGDTGWSWRWDRRQGWWSGKGGDPGPAPGRVAPPEVREAVLYACRLALAGVSGGPGVSPGPSP
jgi:hypothetical protein